MQNEPRGMAGDGLKELLTRAVIGGDWPYPINTVFNLGAALIDGETLLLCRVEERRAASPT